MIYGPILIILGILLIPSIIISKKPNDKEILDKVIPFQGWTGVVLCIGAIFGINVCIRSIRSQAI